MSDKNYADVKLGNPIDHTNKGKRQSDLMAFLADEYKRYNAEILPLYPDVEHGSDNGYEQYDADKNEFLENLWDTIQQHFDDKTGTGTNDNENQNENDVR